MNLMIGAFKVDCYRVRLRVLYNLFMMVGQKETIEDSITADVEMLITQRKNLEKNKKVLKLITHPEYATQMVDILRGNWKCARDKIKDSVRLSLRNLDKLQAQIRTERDPDLKDLLIKKCLEVQEKLNIQVSNLEGTKQQMCIAINF
jgi:hypothetical protein